MKFLYDLFPLLLFFAAFKFYGIYIATAVAMVASLVQVGAFWLKHRRFETTHLVTLAVIVVFGGLTIALHDDTFIKWKPTLVYWIFAALLLGSQVFGQKTAIERMLGKQFELPPAVWARQNLSWAIFFVVAGALNLYVAFYYERELDAAARLAMWVNFKTLVLPGITLAFALLQAMSMARHAGTKTQKHPGNP